MRKACQLKRVGFARESARSSERKLTTRRLSVLARWRPYFSFFLSFFSFFSFTVSLVLLVFALGFLSLLFDMLRGYTGSALESQ